MASRSAAGAVPGELDLVLETHEGLLVVARTDATEESEILRRAKALAATDADVLLVDGVRSVEWIRRVRGVIGDSRCCSPRSRVASRPGCR